MKVRAFSRVAALVAAGLGMSLAARAVADAYSPGKGETVSLLPAPVVLTWAADAGDADIRRFREIMLEDGCL